MLTYKLKYFIYKHVYGFWELHKLKRLMLFELQLVGFVWELEKKLVDTATFAFVGGLSCPLNFLHGVMIMCIT
jgi:hypothetical protein